MKTKGKVLECSRCGLRENLEEDHIIQKAYGGSDNSNNKRILCQACHDFRHTKDNIIINHLGYLMRDYPVCDKEKFKLWLLRLGVLEAYNTPKMIRERGYVKYWEITETHKKKTLNNFVMLNQTNKGEVKG